MKKLYFKYGTMSSSKSAQLLMTSFNYKQKGYNVLLIKPVIDKGQQIAASTKGTNYLGEAYCIKPGISSTRLRPYQGNDAALRQNFPQCTGWCENYYN